jgi:hypothetical protein
MITKPLSKFISKKRIFLNSWQTIEHYSFILFPLIVLLYFVFNEGKSNDGESLYESKIILFLILLSVVVSYLKWKELAFYQLDERRSDVEFENAVLASANKLEWEIVEFKNDFVEAIASNIWKSNDHQKIVIIREENRVLINSMNEPSLVTLPDFILGLNKKNCKTFLHYYYYSNMIQDLNEKVLKNLKEKEEHIENENEWSFINIMKRVIAYIVSLGFLGLAYIFYIQRGLDIFTLLLILFGTLYVIIDLYVIFKKMRKGKN